MVSSHERTESLGKIKRILEAIPCDEWASAAEIATVAGVSPHEVGALISFHLLGAYVERRKTPIGRWRNYIYRRLTWVARRDRGLPMEAHQGFRRYF